MRFQRTMAAGVAALLLWSAAATGCSGKDSKGDTSTEEGRATATVVVNGQVMEPTTGNAAESAGAVTMPAPAEPAAAPDEGVYGGSYDTEIRLGEAVTVHGEGALAEGTTVTVTAAGTYLVSGTLNGGQLVVDTADERKVVLVLNGASVASATGPAILVRNAPKKVVLYTAAGSVNLLSDGGDYVVPDEEQVEGELYPNACIYACDDLELDGEGVLQITGNADKGINTKDDLTVKGGEITVTAAGVGVRGKDSVSIRGGTLSVTAGGDGIKTANTEEGKGVLTVEGGEVYITATGDGLSAATDLHVTGGTVGVITRDTDGTTLSDSTDTVGSTRDYGFDTLRGPGGGFPGGGFPGGMGGMGEAASQKASISAKGLKAEGELTVSGGSITLSVMDDGLHSNGNITVSGGTLHISAADDGIHADGELVISGGVTEVAQSYEGLEALHITVLGGTNRITASDDGANASDGSGGGMGGMGGPWGATDSTATGSASATDSPLLTFAGGYSVFNASGDGIDSNGNIVMTGGTVIVYGPTNNGNGAIDFGDRIYGMTLSGGTFLAVGSSGMAESPENAGQAVLAAYWNGGGLSAGETVGITDKDGRVLAAFLLPKSIQSIVFSSGDLVAGETYSIVGGGSTTGTVVDGVIHPSTYTGYESMGEIEAY